MFRNYFKIAWRNLVANRASSAVNIGGLTIGIAVAILVGLWIYDEFTFNRYHDNYSRIAQVMTRGSDPKDGPFTNNSMQYPLASLLMSDYRNDFSYLVRASWPSELILSAGEARLSVKGQFMDADAPAMLTLQMERGNWNALRDPYSIILSSSMAKALFANADPINQVVTLNNKTNVKVTGVYTDLPRNTQFRDNQFFSSWKLWESQNEWIQKKAVNDWNNHFIKLYACLKPGLSIPEAENRISDLEINAIAGIENYKEEAAHRPLLFLYPMRDWHLYPFKRAATDEKPVRMVWMIGTIGMFVLLLACINFMNLSTARSEKRAKEVGIRKTIGSMRRQLVYQFLGESLLVVLISFILSCLLVKLSLHWFNDLAAKDMKMPWNDGYFWLFSFVFIVFTSLLAGSYPAFYLSSFRPVKVLKGGFRVGRMAGLPRKILVVTQFSVSIALIISTIVVFRQLQFAKDRPVGYTREGLITIEMKSNDISGKYDVLRRELQQTGAVEEVSASMGKVTEVVSGNNGFDWRGRDPGRDESFGTLTVTPEQGKTVGWQFISGRDFSRSLLTDSSAVVINEAAAAFMHIDNPVGEYISWSWFPTKTKKTYQVIGIIRNMVMESPFEPVGPTMFFLKAFNGGVNWMNIRIKPGLAMNAALPKIETVFRKMAPGAPFDYKYVDEEYALKFAAEERISKLAGFFAVLAIFISCLGLFGLASFVAEQRTKEIGIRKILGATLLDVWALLSKEFVWLVLLASLIAIPAAGYCMDNWLENYPYRVELSWWIFGLAGSSALLISLCTVSFQAIKAGVSNPVKSLRTE